MRFSMPLILCFLCATAIADTPADLMDDPKFKSIEERYQAAKKKAAADLKRASDLKIKNLKSLQAFAERAGDTERVKHLQQVIDAQEAGISQTRARPAKTVKFGRHRYAVIDDKVTWHVAKRLCEEMGGYLACCETEQEASFVTSLCGDVQSWVGATNEESAGDWRWLSGEKMGVKKNVRLDDGADYGASLMYVPNTKRFADCNSGYRIGYVCEWDH
jgi:hypothetical protein